MWHSTVCTVCTVCLSRLVRVSGMLLKLEIIEKDDYEPFEKIFKQMDADGKRRDCASSNLPLPARSLGLTLSNFLLLYVRQALAFSRKMTSMQRPESRAVA